MKISEAIFRALNGNCEAAIKATRHYAKKKDSASAIKFVTLAVRYANDIENNKNKKTKVWGETIKMIQEVKKISLRQS